MRYLLQAMLNRWYESMALAGMYCTYVMNRVQKGMDIMEDEMHESDIDKDRNVEGEICENDTTYIVLYKKGIG